MKIKSICINEEAYPSRLREISQPPQKLYYAGNIDLLNRENIVAVIGSRKPTGYGESMAFKLGQSLGERNVVVVSGMAQGIDSASHKGCLYGGGDTIAVLGTGIDKCYPAMNRELKRIICEKGLLITEYESGFNGSKYSFVLRNRIISGIAKAVVVVEAGIRSGSLITAEYGAEQGKFVYAVPGNITSPQSLGCNKLIAEGAQLLTGSRQLLEDIGLRETTIKDLYGDELKIYNMLAFKTEMNIDEIPEILHISRERVFSALATLEIKGIIYSTMGKIFIAK